MEIVHIVPNLAVGGVQSFTIDLANEQSLRGHDIAIVTMMDSGNNNFLNRCERNVEIINLNTNTRFYNLYLMYRIYKIVSSKGRDAIIHTHGIALYFSLFCSFILRKVNFFHTVHNLSQNEAGKVRRQIAKLGYRLSLSHPITISDEVSESFDKHYTDISYKQINNGLSSRTYSDSLENNIAKEELESLKADTNTRIFISVGRVDYQKNRKTLLDAFLRFSENRNIALIILGGPIDNENKFYDDLANHPAVKANKVFFLGTKNNVHDYLVHSDYFCLTSLFEGLPIAILEALRAGLICVCTPAGGIKSLLKDIGYLSTGFDVDSFVAALEQAEENPKRLEANQVISYFNKNNSMNTCSDDYLRFYSSL